MLMSTEYVLLSRNFMVGMEHCIAVARDVKEMSLFQGGIDEVRP